MLAAIGAMVIASIAAPLAFGRDATTFAIAYLVVRALHLALYRDRGTRGPGALARGAAHRALGVPELAAAHRCQSSDGDGETAVLGSRGSRSTTSDRSSGTCAVGDSRPGTSSNASARSSSSRSASPWSPSVSVPPDSISIRPSSVPCSSASRSSRASGGRTSTGSSTSPRAGSPKQPAHTVRRSPVTSTRTCISRWSAESSCSRSGSRPRCTTPGSRCRSFPRSGSSTASCCISSPTSRSDSAFGGGLGRGRPIAALVLLALLPVATHVPAAAALGMVAAVCVLLIAYEVLWHREDRALIRSRRGELGTDDLARFERWRPHTSDDG